MASDEKRGPLDLILGPPGDPRREKIGRLLGRGAGRDDAPPPEAASGKPASPPAPPPAPPPVPDAPAPTAYDAARAEEVRDFRPVLSALVEARGKLREEALRALEYLKELQGRMLAGEGLAAAWDERAAQVLALDPQDASGLARYAVKKKILHAREGKAQAGRVREVASTLHGLMGTVADLDAKIDAAAHLERRIALSKSAADAKAQLVNFLHEAAGPDGAGDLFARLAHVANVAEAESGMGDAMLDLEMPDADAPFADAEVDAELRRLRARRDPPREG